jgi:hypothetical protein
VRMAGLVAWSKAAFTAGSFSDKSMLASSD